MVLSREPVGPEPAALHGCGAPAGGMRRAADVLGCQPVCPPRVLCLRLAAWHLCDSAGWLRLLVAAVKSVHGSVLEGVLPCKQRRAG